MLRIKFGTDGWRARISSDFTPQNVARVTQGVANYLNQYGEKKKVVVGFDCRLGGKQFSEVVRTVLNHNGCSVVYYDQPITTPAISLAAKHFEADLGIILTASHNPPDYNGYKLKGAYGGPLLQDGIKMVEDLIPDELPEAEIKPDLNELADLKELYTQTVLKAFDIEAIKKSGIRIAYDAMYGSGQFVFRELFPEASLFRCEWIKHFHGISPEPIEKNLGEFRKFLIENPGHDFALVNDGDADRIGLMDGDGNFIDSHTIMLLLLHYLHNYKGWRGKVATGFSSTVKIGAFCRKYGLELEIVPIGFKHICGLMVNEDLLLGGEESGGIAVKGHIPERDGIWNGLVLLQFMMESGKTLHELIAEVKELLGDFAYKRIDLELTESKKNVIVEKCRKGLFEKFGELEYERTEDLDGFKYYFNENEWLLIRASGTEPVLRTYAEGISAERAEFILEQCHQEILS